MLYDRLLKIPPVIAHRGARSLAPENTIAAMKKAKECGASWVEFDVMLAKCGTPVVIHDHKINRTTNGKGKVVDYTFDELKNFDAGSYFHKIFSNERISSLIEIIDCCRELKLGANIEIKPNPDQEKITSQKIFECLTKHWTDDLPPALLSSFSVEALREIFQLNPKINLACLMHSWDKEILNIADELNCVSIHVNHRILTKSRITFLKSSNRLLLSYTVNRLSRAKKLFEWGVDSVFTDKPDLILKNI